MCQYLYSMVYPIMFMGAHVITIIHTRFIETLTQTQQQSDPTRTNSTRGICYMYYMSVPMYTCSYDHFLSVILQTSSFTRSKPAQYSAAVADAAARLPYVRVYIP